MGTSGQIEGKSQKNIEDRRKKEPEPVIIKERVKNVLKDEQNKATVIASANIYNITNVTNTNEKKEPESSELKNIQQKKKENDKEEKKSDFKNIVITAGEKVRVFMKVLKSKNLMPIILDYLDNESYRKYKMVEAYNNYLSGNKEKKVIILRDFDYSSLPLILKIKNIRKMIIKNYIRYLPLIQTMETNNITELEIENDVVEWSDLTEEFCNLKSLKLQCKNFIEINNPNNIQILNLSKNNFSSLDYN